MYKRQHVLLCTPCVSCVPCAPLVSLVCAPLVALVHPLCFMCLFCPLCTPCVPCVSVVHPLCLNLQADLLAQWLELQPTSGYSLCPTSRNHEGQDTTQKRIAIIHYLSSHMVCQAMKPLWMCQTAAFVCPTVAYMQNSTVTS